MNERIKELVLSLYPEPELKDRNFGLGAQLRAAQQGIEVLDITEEWLRKEYPWEPCIRYKDIPKFAELIIRECADYIQHFYGDIAASSIGNDIKLHFGIEE